MGFSFLGGDLVFLFISFSVFLFLVADILGFSSLTGSGMAQM